MGLRGKKCLVKCANAPCRGIHTKNNFNFHKEAGIKLKRTRLSRRQFPWKRELFQRANLTGDLPHWRKALIQMTASQLQPRFPQASPLSQSHSGKQRGVSPEGGGRESCGEQGVGPGGWEVPTQKGGDPLPGAGWASWQSPTLGGQAETYLPICVHSQEEGVGVLLREGKQRGGMLGPGWPGGSGGLSPEQTHLLCSPVRLNVDKGDHGFPGSRPDG